ncbi:saccharopine dehydrogenase NADP-binding domain-containing protein [Tamlana sp. s12]|uniref:saccharopine dehydrogenase family protein n=1 Tax=Tamlana sp. s12 TaxID=1630406 RepID=UPI0007FF31C2|nr:saccharopine dehydrogenase C-terminal domain-containing protein [Tamlana sp. s12]OBQ57283.1 saccharopine dehydrogenase [Tamlana sp. s12]QQY82526.1 saccharopine dehydrogenase NADP-binding domain-containing protein [Tamlana sp. s12]
MRQILVIGSGKSTSYLLKYLCDHAFSEDLFITVADLHIENAESFIQNNARAQAIKLDIFDAASRFDLIKKADIVISMLPAHLHIDIAKDCLKANKHMVTASYVSPEMQALDVEARSKNLIFLNEIGVDPGLDHMSAMQIIDRLRENGAQILSFESYTGGLIAPECDNNPWHYKFTWNPRNVVLAGQHGTAKYLKEGSYKYIHYHQLFKRVEPLSIKPYGDFEVYANRDSLQYKDLYQLNQVKTLLRGTIRRSGFCEAWHVFVSLGMTDNSYSMIGSESLSHRDFLNAFLPYHPSKSVESKLKDALQIDAHHHIWEKLESLNLFNNSSYCGIKNATPAQMLEKILTDAWSLTKTDKDMLVMYHKIGYKMNNKNHELNSNLVVIGEDSTYTAMSKTVGVPIAIATCAILNKKITQVGVQIPIAKTIYSPILKELQDFGIIFNEHIKIY